MDAAAIELVAYLLILPLRLLGLIGGRRVRERTQRVEAWLLRQAWQVGASGGTFYPNTVRRINEEAHDSLQALEFKEQAELDLKRTTPELERGPKRVEAADADAPRSEQVREAMLDAQRRREVGERRSAQGLRRPGKRRRRF